IPHVRHGPAEFRIPFGTLKAPIEIAHRWQAVVVEARQHPVALHWRKPAVRGEHDIPTGVSGHNLRQHLLVAFVGAITEANTVLLFEAREHRGIDVARPVVYIQAWARIARTGHEGAAARQKSPAVHRSCSLCEIRMIAPNATTIKAETAFTTGLTPRR